MPYDDPDPEDPMELCAISLPDPDGAATRHMAECFAEEFLRLGYTTLDVMGLFRAPDFTLPHRAWCALGDDCVRAIVDGQAGIWSTLRTSSTKL